jgi:hypothetical protein
MAPALPGPDSRWRCSHCGNLTRFDVTRTRTTVEFWHVSLSGEPDIEETELQDETIEKVTCRWCGAADAVEVVAKPENPEDHGDAKGLGGTP